MENAFFSNKEKARFRPTAKGDLRLKDLRIVFMGTPDFASAILRRLIDTGRNVVGVLSQPDKPVGRKQVILPTPVKELALANGIPVWQPVKLRDGTALALLRELAPDLIVVAAYGRILPADLLQVPPLGCVNIHGSLLPKYRGAAPIQWSVLNGEEKTGVTAMYMAEGMDTGDMILKLETPVGPDETSGELFERMAALGADAIEQTLALFDQGTVPHTPQNDAEATFAPMLTKEMSIIDFTKTARELHNLARGLDPWPVAGTALGGKSLKVYKMAAAEGVSGEPGVLLDDRRFVVGCGDGAVELLEVCPEGGKRMSGTDFMRGRRPEKGTRLG